MCIWSGSNPQIPSEERYFSVHATLHAISEQYSEDLRTTEYIFNFKSEEWRTNLPSGPQMESRTKGYVIYKENYIPTTKILNITSIFSKCLIQCA